MSDEWADGCGWGWGQETPAPDYKVEAGMDWTYDVVSYRHDYDPDRCEKETHFSGSLSDCEAWIRLREDGRL